MPKINKNIGNIPSNFIDWMEKRIEEEYGSILNYDDTQSNSNGIKVGFHRTGRELAEMNEEIKIQSYQPQCLVDSLNSRFSLDKIEAFLLNLNNNIDDTHKIIVHLSRKANKETISNIRQFMRWNGYVTETKKPEITNNKLEYLFIPKYKFDTTSQIKVRFGYLYHVVPTKYVKEIKEQGIQTNNGNIYLLTGTTPDLLRSQIISLVENNIINIKDNDKFSLLTIEIRKLPNDISFYADATSNGAIYTHDNIPPTAIVEVDEFEVN